MASAKPHAVFIPAPAQSHIKAMLKLAKILHHKGFHITFVNTEFNHKRFLKSQGPNSLDGLPDFRFETIPDSLPESDEDATQDVAMLCDTMKKNFLAPFCALIEKLNNSSSTNPSVSCIVSDGLMSVFSITAAEEFGVPVALFFTFAACSLMGFTHYGSLIEKGLAPFEDESCFTNGFLDKKIDWIPGMKDICLKDLPTFFRTTNPNDIIFNYFTEATGPRIQKASAIILHTFDALEQTVLDALSSKLSLVYGIGPIQLLLDQIPQNPLTSMGYSLWKEEPECLEWLKNRAPNSVVYVNFGSIAVLTPKQLVEFGWGLANSKFPFFWVIRPDLVIGDTAILPPEFVDEIKDRGLLAHWCPQEQVLNHPSVGGFLTHCGWNSTIESLTSGVPMLCWPFFADQQTDCYFCCKEWGVGMEISNDVKRDEVEKLVRELMEGEKGKEMRSKALGWRELAHDATAPHGSSSVNLDNLVNQVLLRKM